MDGGPEEGEDVAALEDRERIQDGDREVAAGDAAGSPRPVKRKRKNGTRGSSWIRERKRWAIYHRDGFRCVYCAKAPENQPLTLDHLVARENGGTNDPSNLVTCCVSCNTSKKDITFRQWLKKLREQGVNTNPIQRRIRRLVKKALQMDWQQKSLPSFVDLPARFDKRPKLVVVDSSTE